jgi:hypothetical protein
MIIESKNSKAFRFKIKIATRVAPFLNRLEMLTTIQFHDQLRFVTEKIHDVGPNWRLTPKACARYSVRTKGAPYQPLGIGQIAAKISRTRSHLSRDVPGRCFGLGTHRSSECPLPNPPPQAREGGALCLSQTFAIQL